MIRDLSNENIENWDYWMVDVAASLNQLPPDEPIQFSPLARHIKDVYFPEEDLIVVKNKVYNFYRSHLKKYTEDVFKEEAPEEPKKTPISENFEPAIIERDWQGDRVIKFGLMGDTQIGSKWTQLTHLHNFLDMCLMEGVKDVYHTGDMSEGWDMRIGHVFELYCMGVDETVSEITKNYPSRPGITTHFITGNHDASFVKRSGHYIGNSIQDKRDDLKYLGQDCAIIKLTPNCTLELRHPWDGTSYAISYKTQKMAEAMAGGEKPNILAVGHYHKAEYIFYRNIHIFQTGCFQAQTPFMRGRSIAAMMGGWIIEVSVDKNGFIKKIKPVFFPYYYGIDNDYLNWR